MKHKINETDLYPAVKQWLEERGYEVYPEVHAEFYGKRADVVGIQGALATVVELKTSMSIDLIGQAISWLPAANYVYVAIPKPAHGINHHAMNILRDYGVGVLVVEFFFDEIEETTYYARSYWPPKFTRKTRVDWRQIITEAHKDNPPGGHRGGGYLTRFKIMLNNIRQFIEWRTKSNGGASIDEILENCWTHYQHPKQSVSRLLRTDQTSWCESYKANGKLYFRAKKTEEGGDKHEMPVVRGRRRSGIP